VIESRWVSKPPAFAEKLGPRRLNHQPFWTWGRQRSDGGACRQVNRALAAEVLAHQHHPPDGLSQAPERRHRLASPELHPSPLPCPRERCRLLKPPALLPTPANGAGLNISGHEQTLHPVNLRQTAAKRTQRRAMVRLNNFWIGASAAWVHSQPPRRHCPADAPSRAPQMPRERRSGMAAANPSSRGLRG
jgi:hypothetical protein